MTFDIPEIATLSGRIEKLESMLAEMMVRSCDRAVVTVDDVCRIEGVSRSQIRVGGSERLSDGKDKMADGGVYRVEEETPGGEGAGVQKEAPP